MSDPLTPSELELLTRMLGDPLSFPTAFKQWVTAWVEANPPQITFAQLANSADFVPFYATTTGESHFTQTSYGDPNVSGAAGPTLTGLPNGRFVALWGGSATGDGASGGSASFAAISVNGTVTTGDLECQLQGIHASLGRADIVTCSNGDGNNTLKVVYKVQTSGHDADFRYRWLVAIKYSNL